MDCFSKKITKVNGFRFSFQNFQIQKYKNQAATLWKRVRKNVYNTDKSKLEFGYPPENISQYLLGTPPNFCTEDDAKLAAEYLISINQSDALWNTRLERRDGLLIVWKASVEVEDGEVAEFKKQSIQIRRGDHSNQLSSIWTHLKRAGMNTSDTQGQYLEMLRAHFYEGEIDLHKRASEHWVKDSAPTIETTIGFIESDRDPSGNTDNIL